MRIQWPAHRCLRPYRRWQHSLQRLNAGFSPKPGFHRASQQVNSIVYDIVHGLNGSISAEHGLGQLKRNGIRHYKSALELELMSKIKHTFDPNNLMNPGKVI